MISEKYPLESRNVVVEDLQYKASPDPSSRFDDWRLKWWLDRNSACDPNFEHLFFYRIPVRPTKLVGAEIHKVRMDSSFSALIYLN